MPVELDQAGLAPSLFYTGNATQTGPGTAVHSLTESRPWDKEPS